MRIAVCCKFTPDTEDVTPLPDGTVNLASANWGVSEYDLQAIQAAADMCGEGDEAVALTVGAAGIGQTKLTKALMSRGNLDVLHRVADDALAGADGAIVARALAALAAEASVDVVLVGEGSSDRYQRVTGSQVAAVLGWPCLTAVDKISVEGDALVVERDLEDGVEAVEVALPCVIAVTSTINTPPLPNMKAVLAAGKKPVEDYSLADLGLDAAVAVETVTSEIPARPGRQQVMLEGSPDEIAAQLVAKLQADQLL